MENELDSVARIHEIQKSIAHKKSLKFFYESLYGEYKKEISSIRSEGACVELGSGGGFVKDGIPHIVTTDVLPYPNVDRVVDATKMPFENESVKFFGMINVFHHVPDVEKMLREIERCLVKGGRALIIDQHAGFLGRVFYKYLHHEPYDFEAEQWSFSSTGPLSGANGALATIVFERDLEKFSARFPVLCLRSYETFSGVRYFLSGGLKKWNLLPGFCYPLVEVFETTVLNRVKDLCLFSRVCLEKK